MDLAGAVVMKNNFKKQSQEFLKYVKKQMIAKQKQTANLAVNQLLQESTPVYLGDYVKSFNIGVNQIRTDYTINPLRSAGMHELPGKMKKDAAMALRFNKKKALTNKINALGLKIGDSVNISNSVPHAHAVEYGSPKISFAGSNVSTPEYAVYRIAITFLKLVFNRKV